MRLAHRGHACMRWGYRGHACMMRMHSAAGQGQHRVCGWVRVGSPCTCIHGKPADRQAGRQSGMHAGPPPHLCYKASLVAQVRALLGINKLPGRKECMRGHTPAVTAIAGLRLRGHAPAAAAIAGMRLRGPSPAAAAIDDPRLRGPSPAAALMGPAPAALAAMGGLNPATAAAPTTSCLK